MQYCSKSAYQRARFAMNIGDAMAAATINAIPKRTAHAGPRIWKRPRRITTGTLKNARKSWR